MKNRILALLLALSFVILPLPFPLTATAGGEDGDAAGPVEDTILFSNASNNTSASSGASNNRWNKLQPGGYTGMSVTPDPENPEVNVTRVLGKKSGCVLMRNRIPTDSESVFEAAFYIVPPVSGSSWMTKLTVKLQQNTLLTLTLNGATGRYDIESGSFTGSVAKETWFRTAVDILPDGNGKADLRFVLLGDILDAEGNPLKGFTETFAKVPYTDGAWHVYFNVPEVSEAGFLIRSAKNYLPGDLVASNPILPKDEEGNTVTYGQIALPLSHVPDPSTLSAGAVHLTTADGDAAVVSDVRYRESDNALLLDFSRHPLIENTQYVLRIDGIRDISAKAPYTAVFTFRPTLAGMGGSGSQPEESDVPAYETPLTLPEYGYIMPDRYNTGYRCAEEDLVPAHEKYPDCFGAGNTSVMVINNTTAAKYGYDFSGFSLTGEIKVTCSRPVSLHDFYLYATSYYGVSNNGCPMVYISWMEGEHSKAAFFNLGNVTIRHAYVHDVCADHMKGTQNQLVESCYFRDGGTRTPGAHADVIQYSGSSSQILNNSRVMGSRFDIPYLCYEHVANCCFFFKPEASFGGGPVKGFSNIQASGNWFNGGGYTPYLTPACPLDKIHYVTYTNNRIGYGHHFGVINFGAYSNADGFRSYEGNAYDGNGYVETLEAGSVVYYAVSGETKTRVYDIADITTGTMEVLVNFANYMTVARSYRIEVALTNADGTVVASGTGADTIRRYIPVKGADGYLEGNTHKITVTNADGTTSEVTALIEMPDLPSDVEATVRLSGLPTDLAGYRAEVKIYDTTSDLAAETMIRSSALTDAVTENEALYDVTPTHTVTFTGMNDAVIGTATVRHNRAVTLPEAPEIPGYVFMGWSDNGTTILRDTTIRANYTEGYVVTFYGKDGIVLSRQPVVAGQAASEPAAPAVSGYRFMGWDAAFDTITHALDVHAVYLRICTVTFRAADGTVLKTEHVLAGGDATPPAAPALAGHTFTGWVGSYTGVYADSLVTAGYDGLYTVTFLGWNGAVLKTQTVSAGEAAVPPTFDDTEAHPFIGWDTNAYLSVSSHLIVRARFEVYHTVTFLDRTGEVLATETVLSGGSVTPPQAPALPGYTFTGWSLATNAVTDDMTVQALYEELPSVASLRQAIAAAQEKERTEASLSERYDAICAALAASRALSDAELAALPELTVALVRLLDNYNTAVRAANEQMTEAEGMRVG